MTFSKTLKNWCGVFLISGTLAFCTSTGPADKDKPAADQQTKTSAEHPVAPQSTAEPLPAPQFFYSLPESIGGCGEYLTYDTTSFESGRFIFLSNLSQFALINIEGKTVRLDRDTAAGQVLSDDRYISVYRNGPYKVVLSLQQAKAYDEGGFYTGTLELSIGERRATYRVHGESGC